MRLEFLNLLDDVLHHDELGHVDDEPGHVTDEEDDDNTNEDQGKVHLVVMTRVVVSMRSVVSIPDIYKASIHSLSAMNRDII